MVTPSSSPASPTLLELLCVILLETYFCWSQIFNCVGMCVSVFLETAGNEIWSVGALDSERGCLDGWTEVSSGCCGAECVCSWCVCEQGGV